MVGEEGNARYEPGPGIAIIADRILRGYANSLGTTDIRD